MRIDTTVYIGFAEAAIVAVSRTPLTGLIISLSFHVEFIAMNAGQKVGSYRLHVFQLVGSN